MSDLNIFYMKKFILLMITVNFTGIIYSQKMNVEPDTKATYSVDSIQIDAPVSKVYSLIANISDWPKWFEGVTEVNINGNVEEGKTFIWKANGYNIKSKIHTVRSNSEIGWTGKMWWINAVHNWYFENCSGGVTKVIIKESFEGIGSILLKNTLKKDMRKDLIVLKKKSEA